MGAKICKCSDGISNSGLPMCVVLEKVAKKVVFVQLVANDGTLNKIDPAGTLDATWLTGVLNNADRSKRFYPTPLIENIDTPKGDPKMEVYKSGNSNFVREDVRKFMGLIPNCPPMYKGNLESIRCNSTVGVFIIDIDGNWRGQTNDVDGYLYPYPINPQSLVAKVVNANDEGTQQLDITFEFPATLKDADSRIISTNDFTGFTLSDVAGLLNASYKLVSITDTVLTVDISVPSPALDQAIPIQGMVTADFISSSTATTSKIYNVTDSADDTIVVAESTSIPGRYTITYSTIATKTLILAAKKNGYDFTAFLTGAALVTP